jgi:hypothetical protein
MDWDSDRTLKTYLHWFRKLPDHALYSDVSFYQCFEIRNIPLLIKLLKSIHQSGVHYMGSKIFNNLPHTLKVHLIILGKLKYV